MKTFTLGRHLNILDYSLYSLKRKLLKNVSIFCIFSLVVFLLCSFQLINRALTEVSQNLLVGSPDITVQQMSAGRQVSISTAVTNGFDQIYGIKKVRERIWGYYFDESNGANYTVIGMTDLFVADNNSASPELEWGRFPLPGEKGKVVISKDVSSLLQLADRNFFSLFRPDLSQLSFETIGLFTKESSMLTADTIFMTLEDARALFDIEKEFVTDLLVYVANPSEVDTIAKKLGDTFPGVRVITKNQILKTYKVVFNWRSGLGTICLLSALFTFGIMVWDKASGLSKEDIHEVGILKAVGWQTADIISLRFYESFVVSILAFSCGYLLGWIHVVFYGGALLSPVMLGFSVLRPSVELIPAWVASDMLLIAAIAIFPYLCATVVPAWKAATVQTESVL